MLRFFKFRNKSSQDCTVMFADIAGSTALYDVLGDAAAKQKIDLCLNLMSKITEDYQGTVIKTIGDEIMCRYPSANLSVQAACAMHNSIDSHHELQMAAMAIRIGLHSGKIIEDKGDIFGDTVNVAARLSSFAKARQILISSVVEAELNEFLKVMARVYDLAPIKGKKTELSIWEIVWEDKDDMTYIARETPQTSAESLKLQLTFNQQNYPVSSASIPFNLGRTQEANILINTQFVSRIHAFIEYSRGKYILVDKSSNGTYVYFNKTQQTVFLHREAMSLTGNGVISLGQTIEAGKSTLVNFDFK
ncbi:MAG: adenylate/guanylate cyclase domain-containing protein [Methylococcales bacterium]|nr:adenylate/guanylate cyclase domain-containing protein [Methylococcales bacterium]